MEYKRNYKIVTLIIIILIIFYLYFNRTPNRSKSDYLSNVVLSPCDGTVMFAEGRDISIGKGVWIGSNATILGPCKIGENSVVASGSVVMGEVSANSLVGGAPAKLIKKIEFK